MINSCIADFINMCQIRQNDIIWRRSASAQNLELANMAI